MPPRGGAWGGLCHAAGAGARKGDLPVPGAADASGLRAAAACQGKGYFKEVGLDVDFQVARGGVEVAKMVGAGNAPIGGIVGDGPIMVRANGVPVKIVALFGGKGFMQTVVREDAGIDKPADLKGKTLTVLSFQDTTFYALIGLLASVGPHPERRECPAGRPDRRVGIGRHRQVAGHGRRAGLAGAGGGDRYQGEGDPDRPVFPASGAGHRGLGRDDQEEPGDDPEIRDRGDARHEGRDGQSGPGRRGLS